MKCVREDPREPRDLEPRDSDENEEEDEAYSSRAYDEAMDYWEKFERLGPVGPPPDRLDRPSGVPTPVPCARCATPTVRYRYVDVPNGFEQPPESWVDD